MIFFVKGFIKKNETEYPNIKEKIGFQLSARFGVEASDVKSSTSVGVSKKVVLFQSYPQIPGEFFTTAF